MTEETKPEVDPAAESVAKPSKKSKVAAPGFKAYRTTSTHTYPIDIQIHGELIYGQWCRSEGIVEFEVPDHLTEGFEKHYHFVSGNIVAA